MVFEIGDTTYHFKLNKKGHVDHTDGEDCFYLIFSNLKKGMGVFEGNCVYSKIVLLEKCLK